MKTAYKDFTSGTLYTFYLPENNGEIADNGKITIVTTTADAENIAVVRVIDSPGYSFKINKKSIGAAGGAYGLFKFVRRCVQNEILIDSVRKIATAF